ncbi:tRNA lysidine(34) synthetase TilS [Lentisphaerota bacterium ZTH]|nr:tRNA lysidine(34) synthetase TilS [Lentisphaerota bacterium]WET05604.1 tRNA lysidine(34) synthetase TilS [Lentisphaerota bacterium ZTH]
MIKDVVKTVANCLNELSGNTVYIGFSGGADSTALLFAAIEAARGLDIQLTAIHFEHGIRGADSRSDADWTKKLCEKHEVKYIQYALETLDNSLPGENIEAAARRLRLKKLQEIAAGKKINILYAHHGDDRTENMFIRLCRGSNVSGLTSLRERNTIGNVTILRPFLLFSKKDLIEFLKDRGILFWCTDKTNFDEDYTRNFFRKRIIPDIKQQLPTSATGFVRAAEALEIDARYIERHADKLACEVTGRELTPLSFWKELDSALLPRVLRKWLTSLRSTEYIPDYDLIKRLQQTMDNDSGMQRLVPLKGGGFIRLHRDIFNYFYSNAPSKMEKLWDWKKQEFFKFGGEKFQVLLSDGAVFSGVNDSSAIFDADFLPEKILFTRRNDGDRIIPFGSQSPQKLKKILIDRKLSAYQKEHIIVMRNMDGEILWVPGVRHSSLAQVTPRTSCTALIRMLD